MDIETRVINNVHVPVLMCICVNNRVMKHRFYDKDNWMNDMANAFKTLLRRKYNYKKIYVHNLSNFDAIFIIDVLSSIGDVRIIKRGGRILSLDFTGKIINKNGKESKINLTFRDSMLLLSGSLDNLSKSFDVRDKKTTFPLLFLNDENVSLKYIGEVPDYKFFPKAGTSSFTKEDYLKYCMKFKYRK